MEDRYDFEDQNLFRLLCGIQDQEVPVLEEMLEVELIPRGHGFMIQTESEAKKDRARTFFSRVSTEFKNRAFDRFDMKYLYRVLTKENPEVSETDDFEDRSTTLFPDEPDELLEPLRQKVFTTARGRTVFPRTIRQARYVDSIRAHTITFGLGPAGTGKTFLAIAAASAMLQDATTERIILTRPAVEAGESLGFLPGDLTQKVDPYLRPVYDALYECLGMEKVHGLIASRRIEIAPLAYMRGRTLNDSVVVLDEAQNCTRAQLKMFLTRVGRNSRMVISGDESQVDLKPGMSGLVSVARMLSGIKGIGIVHFGKEDIVRNPIVERIVQAFEDYENNRNQENLQQSDNGDS